MKSIIRIAFFVFLSTISFAQSQNFDIIYLKKGGEVHGTIIESSSKDQVSIRSESGQVFHFSRAEIKEISKTDAAIGVVTPDKGKWLVHVDDIPISYVKEKRVKLFLKNGSSMDCIILDVSKEEVYTVQSDDGEVMHFKKEEINGVSEPDQLDYETLNNQLVKIYFYSGKKYSGILLEENDDEYVFIEASKGDTLFIPWERVQSIKNFYAKSQNALNKELADPFFIKKRDQYVAIGVGIGYTYGGFGAQFQSRFGKKMGVGFHFGFGYLPEINDQHATYLFNIGAKAYLYKAVYFDISYGKLNDGILGFGTKIGADFFIYEHLGMTLAGGFVFPRNYGLSATFDIGFFLKL